MVSTHCHALTYSYSDATIDNSFSFSILMTEQLQINIDSNNQLKEKTLTKFLNYLNPDPERLTVNLLIYLFIYLFLFLYSTSI